MNQPIKLIHIPTGIVGYFIREVKPTGKPLTINIMTDKGVYFAPSFEFTQYYIDNLNDHIY